MAPTLEAYSSVRLKTNYNQPNYSATASECCSWVATPWLGHKEGLRMEGPRAGAEVARAGEEEEETTHERLQRIREAPIKPLCD